MKTSTPTAPTTHGPTVRDLLNARSHACGLLRFPQYPPDADERKRNKALFNTIALLDELIVARLVRRDAHEVDKETTATL